MKIKEFFKRYKRIIKETIIVVGVVVGVIIAFVLVNNYKSSSSALPNGMEVSSLEEQLEEYKNEDSDIEGMTKYDKYKMGLNVEDGSDTDEDGLTDKEEIEEYGSDPLKYSTADDMYSDSYKVKHDMDFFTAAEYDGTTKAKNNNCEEVILDLDEAADLTAYVTDGTDDYSLNDFGINTVYKGYKIYNYNGKVSIDIKKILKKNNIELSDISVYICPSGFVYYGLTDLENCKYTENDSVIDIDYELEGDQTYYIYITEKKKISANGALYSTSSSTSSLKSVDTLTCLSPLGHYIFNSPVTVYYVGSDDDETKEAVKEVYIKYIKENDYPIKMKSDEKIKDIIKLTGISSAEMVLKYTAYHNNINFFEYTKGSQTNLRNIVYAFYYIGNIPVNSKVDNGSDSNTGFDVYTDELPFYNFGSYISSGGNCAGISHMTALLFNNKTMTSKGTYKCKIEDKKKKVSWDLTDESNATLLDSGLYDYKTTDFVKENAKTGTIYLKDENLTKAEKNFVKMIGCYWTEANKKIDLESHMHTRTVSSNLHCTIDREDWQLIEDMMDYLDSGKILDVAMYLRAGYGHTVNVYDYKVSGDDVFFYVYDSNFPQDSRAGYTLNDNRCYLKVCKMYRKDGSETFEYIYYPLYGQANVDYSATSDPVLMERNALVVMDENWNVFNK